MEEKENKPWRPELEVSNKATIEELKFVFEQVKKRVEETAKEGDDLYSKSFSIVLVTTSLLTGTIGFLLSNISTKASTFIALVIAIILVVILSTIRDAIAILHYRSSGTPASYLLVKDFYENLEEGKTPEWYMVMREVIRYEERLTLNADNNVKRIKKIEYCYRLFYAIPVASLITWFVYLFFSTVTL